MPKHSAYLLLADEGGGTFAQNGLPRGSYESGSSPEIETVTNDLLGVISVACLPVATWQRSRVRLLGQQRVS